MVQAYAIVPVDAGVTALASTMSERPGAIAAKLLWAEPQPIRRVERVGILAHTAQTVNATMVAPELFTPYVR